MKKILIVLGTLFLVLVLAYIFHTGGTREGLTRSDVGMNNDTQLIGDEPFSLDNNQDNDGFQTVLDRDGDPLISIDGRGNMNTVKYNEETGETRTGGDLSTFTGGANPITDDDIDRAVTGLNTDSQTGHSLNEMNNNFDGMDIDP